MRFSETFNFVTILNNILRTIIIIVISLANFHRGSTSHIQINGTNQNADIFKNMSSKMVVPHSALGSFVNSLLEQTSLSNLKSHKHQHVGTSQASELSTRNDLSNHIRRRELVNEKHLNAAFTPSNNEQSAKQLSSVHASHKVVGLVSPGAPKIFQLNNSNEILNNSIYKTPMYFGTENSTVIPTQIGATAHLSCIVHHIGECVVSWIRRKDYHLLTVGLTTYSSDERFTATHLHYSEDWTLQIKFVQKRDAGIYECQVSTHPPTSIFTHLVVVEARAEISGPNIRYLTPGSTLRLQCHVVQNTENSEYIFWYHDNRMINYDADRGINVSTEPDFQSSELTISRTRREHSGNYTCVASNTQPASVLVHIFKGDNPAAMYHGDVGSSTKSYQTYLLHHVMTVITTIYGSYVKRKFCYY